MTQFSALIPAGGSSDPTPSSLAGNELAYWQAQLLHLPLVQIPADYARAKATTYVRSSYPTTFSPALSAALVRLAASEQTTITQVCMAAFKVLLTYYINHEDIVIGSVVQEDQHHHILVLRTDLSGNPSFREVVRRVTLEWEEATKHANVPFDVLRAFLQPQLDMLHHTLYQVMFSVYNQSVQTYAENPEQRACDLSYTIINDGETLIGYIDYNKNIFTEDTIKQFVLYFELILTSAVEDSDQRIHNLLNLSASEQAFLTRRRGAAIPVNSQVLPAQLVERWAIEQPKRLAVVQGDIQFTYGEINARANQIAHLLREQGIGPETRVAVCFERSCDLVIALLAIFKASGAYVPLDPHYPKERIMFMLADARVSLILSDEQFAPLFAHFDGPIITKERSDAAISRQPTTTPAPQATAQHLAYVIYTSGSMGRPKGVMVTYASLLNLINWHTRAFDLTPEDRATLIASPAFDASVWEIWPSLAAGAMIAIPDDETRINPEALRAWLLQEAITITFLPTPLAEQLLVVTWPRTAALRLMLTGGDTLHHYPAADLPFTLINNYGPTETTVVATSGPIIAQERNPATPSIGRLIDNSEGYVLNHSLQLVPTGIPGELYLGGKGLARGYLDRPEITAERFLPDPFSGRPGDRLYRTGDIVRYRTDGDIEYLGRADGQVKIRGHRIELGEIKVVLNEHPDVTEAAVVVHGSGADSRLVGYVVPRKDALVDSGMLQEWVRERVPAYMVPAAVALLDKLPLTPNGKLDRQALPVPTWHADAARPRNEREQRIAAIWQAVLGVDTVSIHDHFFHIGGHSLLATQMLGRLKEAFQIDLSFRILFEHPTIAGLAEVIAGVGQSQPEIAIGRQPRPAVLPLSAAQQRLWFLEQLTPGTAVYNVPLAYELRGALDRAALRQSVDGLVARHEILRTTFIVHAGAPVQHIHPPRPVAIALLDDALPDPAAALAAAARQPFDLAAGPLFRVVLAPRAPDHTLLLLVFHHTIIDGWSAGLLLRELSARYAAARAGAVPPVPAPPVQYADLALWETDPRVQAARAAQVAYWVTHLAGSEPVEVPADGPRPAVQTQRGALLPLRVPAEVAAGVTRLAQAAGATPYMVLLTVYAALLGRYSGQDTVVVGTPIANRQQVELEGLLGCVVNTLALRVELGGQPSGWALLERVRQVCLAGYAHQEAPFEQVVDAVQLPRDLSRSPIFQHMFVLQDEEFAGLPLAQLETTPIPIDLEVAHFDLTLELRPVADEYVGVLEYNTGLYGAGTAAQIGRHFLALLRALVAQPAAPVAALPVLAPAEQHALRATGAAPALPVPARALHQLVRDQLRRAPRALVLRAPHATWDAATLLAQVDALAAALAPFPLGPEVRVGVCLDRTPALLVALLAILQAGAAYVPLDPAYPPDRLAFMAADAGLALVLTTDQLRDRLPALAAPLVCLDPLGLPVSPADVDAAGIAAPAARWVDVAPEQTAYLIYTSGSTGRPKAVVIPHRSAVAFVQWSLATFSPADLAGVFAATSLSFDLSVFELFVPLAAGGAVILADSPLHLPTHPAAHHVSLLNTVPSVLSELLRLAPLPPGVRTVNLAGEPLPASLAAQVYAQPGVQALFNLYGPSEDTTYSTVARIARDGGPSVPIGRPIANTRAYVCDPRGALVPPGVWGELLLGGAGLARGYLARPDLTAEKFAPDPFGDQPGGRLYRTGDRVRWTPAGALEYGGRLDQQVKLRGYRIELGEVAAALARQPGVADAIALVHTAGPAPQLVGYVVEHAGAALQGEGVRRGVAEHLPGYMVPAAVVVLGAWPLTPNGKLDRRALPAPRWAGEGPRLGRGPGSALETQVAAVWEATLGAAPPDVETSFFAVGGHSLLATQLVARLRAACQVDLELRVVFEHPTVAELASVIATATARRAEIAIGRQPRPAVLPLSAAQQRLWFLEQLTPGTAVYHIAFAYELRGALDRAALRQSVDGLVARHEILRTTFIVHAGAPVQHIHPPRPVAIALLDDALPDPAAALAAAARQPFDLAAGPLFRVVLAPRAPDHTLLLLVFHHTIIDGWSAGLLLRELSARYAAARAGAVPPVPAPPVQYADLALWETDPRVQAARAAQVAYWVTHLAGSEPVEVPADGPRPAVQTQRGALLPLRVPAEVAAGVTRLAQAAGATPYMVLLTVYAALLGRYSGQDTVVVGTPIANRQQVELEGLLGCVVNTLALRVELGGQPSGWALLERVRQVCLAGYAHQEAPFEQVVDAVQLPRDLSRSPIFQHMFVLQDEEFAGLPLAQLETTPIPIDLEVAHFDLTLELRPVADEYVGVLEYNTGLYGAGTAAQIGRHFLALLRALVAQPAAPVAALPVLAPAEQHALRATGAAPALPVPARALHQLVRDQLRRAPRALVLRAPHATWDAATLLAQVDALAAALAPFPLGPEVRVGVCLDRTPALLVALLAILQAGAAYVPLDPAYPPDRLAFMAADAGLALVLTTDQLRDRLPALAAPLVCLDPLGLPVSPADVDAAGIAAPAARWVDVAPEQTAYLIYTSGSTGRPKAVVIPHRSAVAFVQWSLATFSPADLAGVFAATSLSFDLSVFELFVPLAAGGAVILADSPLHLPTHPAAHHVSLLNTVPSVLSELLRLAPLPPGVRTVNLAGEPLPASLAAQVYAQPGVQALFNLYGPSEDTTYSTVARIARDGGPSVPIGRPIANTRAYVCDPRGALVPPGVWGELLLGGAGLARGYLARPDLTAEKFAPDPFGDQPGGRLYRTGDRVRWTPAGALEYGGRLDQQVKLRGYRIELGEVAAALARQPGVADAIALVHTAGPAPQLVGYVIAAPNEDVTSDGLRQGLAAALPGYMVPAAVVVLGAWPLTPNGKLDRRALPAPRWAGEGPRLGRGPGSALETQVAAVWEATLGAAPPDVETSFFAVGGHSLLATQLVARLRAACQVDLELRVVFEHPTVAELAVIIEQQQARGAASQAPAIGRANRQARRVQISAQGVLGSSQDKES